MCERSEVCEMRDRDAHVTDVRFWSMLSNLKAQPGTLT